MSAFGKGQARADRIPLSKRIAPAIMVDKDAAVLLVERPIQGLHRASDAEIYGLDNIANLEKVPLKGAILIALLMKIKAGSGGPVRIVALLAAPINSTQLKNPPKNRTGLRMLFGSRAFYDAKIQCFPHFNPTLR